MPRPIKTPTPKMCAVPLRIPCTTQAAFICATCKREICGMHSAAQPVETDASTFVQVCHPRCT